MSDNIKVVVKVRPLIARELDDGAVVLWRARNNTLFQLESSGRDTSPAYTFDKVYDAHSETKVVYDDIARPIVEAATAGINGTIFAYGQTSSGKTYTMMGDDQSPGIIPLAIWNIFERIKNIPSRDFLLRVSYIEIYNETIKDLLSNNKEKIKIFETVAGSVKVNATEKVTSSPEEVLEIMKDGEVNRQVGATNMNEKSSRSHTIFQITIESREHTEDEEDAGCVNVSQLNLVDLAGSERSGQTGATGQRFREGTHINKSLSALGLVIKQLADDPNKYVNYRDSKLTRILQNSLGGNAKTSIICAVTPAALEETISTLQFANRAKAIKNSPEVNAVATNATMLQSLTKKLASLQYELDNKKHLEHDNEKLMRMIENLQKQILFGIDRPTAGRVDRRKTWCAPRRATISTLLPIREESAPRFCTPSLKYNSSLQPDSSQFLPLRRTSDIPEGDEEPVTPPPRRRNVAFTDEVITLDDSDDFTEGPEQTCSPYHRCYETSKTPPCVLRDKVKKAEHSYHDLIELTEREKIYSPQTVELMERLDKHSFDLVTVREEYDKAIVRCEEKDKEIRILKEKNDAYERELTDKTKMRCEENEKEMNLLKDKIQSYEREIQEKNSSKVDLEALCHSYKTRLTDLEVSLESCIMKAKQRESDLLSLLEDKAGPGITRISDKFEKAPASEVSSFMNMSKDLSLVDSDVETSVASINIDKFSGEVNIKSLQVQITEKNDLISELHKKLFNAQQSITIYKNELESSNSRIIYLQKNISELEMAVENLNIKLAKSEADVNSYDHIICDLKNQMIANELETEKKLSSNNEEISNVVDVLKTMLDNRNEEINSLKTEKCGEDFKSVIENKDKLIVTLEEEIKQLKHICDNYIKDLDNAKAELLQINKKTCNENSQLLSDYASVSDHIENLQLAVKELHAQVYNIKGYQTKKNVVQPEVLVANCDINKSLNHISEKDFPNILKVIGSNITQISEKIMQTDNETMSLYILKESLTSEIEKLKIDVFKKNEESIKATNNSVLILNNSKEMSIKISSLEFDNNLLKENLMQKESNIERLEIELQELNTKLNDQISNGKKEICNVLNTIETQIKYLIDNISELFCEININNVFELQSETSIYETIDNQQFKLQERIDILCSVFTQIKQKYCELKQTNLSLQNTLQTLSESTEQQAKELLELKIERAKLQNEVMELNTNYTPLVELKENFSVIENKNDELIRQIDQHIRKEVEIKKELVMKDSEIEKLTENDKKTTSKAVILKEMLQEKDIQLHNIATIMPEFDLLRNEHIKLKEIIAQKDIEINAIVNNTRILKEKEDDLLNTIVFDKNNLHRDLNEKEEQLSELKKCIGDLLHTVDNQYLITNNMEVDNIQVILPRLRNIICSLKINKLQVVSSNDHGDEQSSTNLGIEDYVKAMKDLKLEIKCNESVIQSLQQTCQDKSLEIGKLIDLNRDANNNLLKHQHLIDMLSNDLRIKGNQLEDLCLNLSQKLKKYDDSIRTLEGNVELLRKSLPIITNGLNKNKVQDLSTPATLMELSLKQVNDKILKRSVVRKLSQNVLLGMSQELESSIIYEECNTNLIDCFKNSNQLLVQKVNRLQIYNKKLESDLRQVNDEVKLLLEPADELYKQISKHRTHLATLAATTYAENKLLKTQVKALHHHHDRLHNVCQREIPELREQLQMLHLILQSELNNALPPKPSLSLFSDDKEQITTDPSEINCNEISLSKYSETLESDMLMLGTNFTLGPSANSTMISQEGLPNASVTMCENINVTEIPCGVNISCQTDLHPLEVTETRVNRNNDRDHLRKCCFISNVNESKAFEVSRNVESSFVPSSELKVELEMHSSDCIIKREFNVLSSLLQTKIKETESLLNSFNSLKQDKSQLDNQSKLIASLRSDIYEKTLEINNISQSVQNMKKEITELQTENDSLSTQVMDSILENDALKDEIARSKIDKLASDKCTECVRKNELISSLHEYKESSENVLRESNKNNVSYTLPSLDITENNMKNENNSLLQNELVTIHEDCKIMDEEVSKYQLARNDRATIKMEKDLKRSSIKEHLSNDLALTNKQSNTANDYVDDKHECLKFLLAKEIYHEPMEFDSDQPIIEMMKFLYDTLWAKHNNEVDNLINKLKHFDDDKANYQAQISTLTEEYESLNEKLKEELHFHNGLRKNLTVLKENNLFILQEASSIESLENGSNSNCQLLFSQMLLEPIDREFSLSTSETFEKMISTFQDKHKTELEGSRKRCLLLENEIESFSQELKIVNEKLLFANSELSRTENELVLLKSHKDKMYQISNAVTKDLLIKEKMLKNIVTENYQNLINQNLISEGDIDTSLPIIEIVRRMLVCVSLRYIKQVEMLSDTGKNEISDLRNQNIIFKEKIQSCTSELQEKEEELNSLKSVNVEYAKQTNVYDNLIKSLHHENEGHKLTKQKVDEQISFLKENLSTLENKITYLENEVLVEALGKIEICQSECTNLKTLNKVLIEENEDLTNKLKIGLEHLESNKKEIDVLNKNFQEIQNANESLTNIMNELKRENAAQNEELVRVNQLVRDKSEELTLLEKNIKTHQRTTDIQTSMYKRLKTEKEETEHALKEKLSIIEQLRATCDDLQLELTELNAAKDMLEVRVTELQSEVDGSQKSGRSSMDTVRTETRRRRQSVHDLQRTFADINENTSPEEKHPDDIFGSGPPVGQLFPDSAPSSRRNSADCTARLERKSDNMTILYGDNGESEAGGAGAGARRRRRQSLHDQHRLSAAHLLGSKEDIGNVDSLQMQNINLKDEINRLKMTIESGPATDDYYNSEIASLKRELESCQKEHADLQERYRELDDECETCAAYLRERDEQCLQLGRSKKALELQLTELSKSLGGGDMRENSPQTVSTGVNTDSDWKLHSAVVDRMSYDAEVEMKRKMTKAVEELRSRNDKLKKTIGELQQQVAACATGQDNVEQLHELRSELEACRAQHEALRRRYDELDEECETCSAYLKERDEQNLRLTREKRALEAKVKELQHEIDAVNSDPSSVNPVSQSNPASVVAQSTRKKRQSCHDMNREPESTTSDAATNTDGGALSALGVDHMTHEAEKERRRRLQSSLDALKARNSELSGELRRLQRTRSVEENTVEMLQPALDRDLLHRQSTEIQQLRARVEELLTRNAMLEHSRSLLSAPPSPAAHLAPPPTILVATGSAIVQNQQLCEFMRENQRLKKMNTKLMNLCKKRGKCESGTNRENEEPH